MGPDGVVAQAAAQSLLMVEDGQLRVVGASSVRTFGQGVGPPSCFTHAGCSGCSVRDHGTRLGLDRRCASPAICVGRPSVAPAL